MKVKINPVFKPSSFIKLQSSKLSVISTKSHVFHVFIYSIINMYLQGNILELKICFHKTILSHGVLQMFTLSGRYLKSKTRLYLT